MTNSDSRNITTRLFGFAFVIFFAVLFGGCATRYNITTNRGYVITAKGKPKFDKANSSYTYIDSAGKEQHISAGSITEIAPESMPDDAVKANSFKGAKKQNPS